MKSCLSLLAALLVMVLLAAGGYWAYQKNTAPASQSGHVLTAVSSDTSFTLTNATNVCPDGDHEARRFAGPISTRPGKE